MPPYVFLIIFFIVLWIVLIYFLRFILETKKQALLKRFADKKIIKICVGANFIGEKRLGLAQIRGNGILVLMEDVLFFQMLLPKKEWIIRRPTIKAIDTPLSFLGKTKGVRMLKVMFKEPESETNAIAWIVKDLDEWCHVLRG